MRHGAEEYFAAQRADDGNFFYAPRDKRHLAGQTR